MHTSLYLDRSRVCELPIFNIEVTYENLSGRQLIARRVEYLVVAVHVTPNRKHEIRHVEWKVLEVCPREVDRASVPEQCILCEMHARVGDINCQANSLHH
jgi:hypothetical protein